MSLQKFQALQVGNLFIKNSNSPIATEIKSSAPSAIVEVLGSMSILTASPSSLIFDFSNNVTGGSLTFGDESIGAEWLLAAVGTGSWGFSMNYIGRIPPDPVNPLNASIYGGAFGGAAFGYSPYTIGVACPNNSTWDQVSATCGCDVKSQGIIKGQCVSLSCAGIESELNNINQTDFKSSADFKAALTRLKAQLLTCLRQDVKLP